MIKEIVWQVPHWKMSIIWMKFIEENKQIDASFLILHILNNTISMWCFFVAPKFVPIFVTFLFIVYLVFSSKEKCQIHQKPNTPKKIKIKEFFWENKKTRKKKIMRMQIYTHKIKNALKNKTKYVVNFLFLNENFVTQMVFLYWR